MHIRKKTHLLDSGKSPVSHTESWVIFTVYYWAEFRPKAEIAEERELRAKSS